MTTPARLRRTELQEKIDTDDPRAGVDAAGFLWDAIAGAGTAGQSNLALLEVLRSTWPDMRQGEAVDYLTMWVEHACTVLAIYPHPQPPTGSGLDWYVTPDNYIKAEPRTVLVQVAAPISLDNLAAALSLASRENFRRHGKTGELTSACVEISEDVVTIYDRPHGKTS